jgi:hypothetical protein
MDSDMNCNVPSHLSHCEVKCEREPRFDSGTFRKQIGGNTAEITLKIEL